MSDWLPPQTGNDWFALIRSKYEELIGSGLSNQAAFDEAIAYGRRCFAEFEADLQAHRDA